MDRKKQSLGSYGGHRTKRKGSRQRGLIMFLLLAILAACSQVTEEAVLAESELRAEQWLKRRRSHVFRMQEAPDELVL